MNNNASKFTWNQESLNKVVHDAASEIRVVRPLLKLYGKQGAYTTNIFGHQIKASQQDKGSPLSIPINQPLTPVILSCDFTLEREQFSDADALNTLAVEAAYRVAAAEDAVILLGEDAQYFIERLGVKVDGEQWRHRLGYSQQEQSH
jgi:Encapsulating protein for peroxidase